jgi:hypothetical protein
MLASNKNVIGLIAAAAILVFILAYIYMSQPSTVGVAPEPARTEQAK